jgi:hypothetical protein
MIRFAMLAVFAMLTCVGPVSAQSNPSLSALLAQGYQIEGQSSSTYIANQGGKQVQKIRILYTLVRNESIMLCLRDMDANTNALSGAFCGALN